MVDKKDPRSFGTHDGSFHADEVTAGALLLLFDLIDEDKIVRTRDRTLLDKCDYICDVGGVYDPGQKLFDHHQKDYQGELSSAGMVLLYLKEEGFLNDRQYRMFNEVLILGVDAHDNGKDPQLKGYATYSHVISNFAPIPYDPSAREQDSAFKKALHFALGHLKRLWRRHSYILSCQQVVKNCMEKYKECLMFDNGIPWQELFFEMDGERHPAKFVIMPSGGQWTLRGIPPTYEDRMNVRVPLPSEWAGLLEGQLEKVSGITGAVFCHKGRFVSVWQTREAALQALEYTLSKTKEGS